jgi:hypothetical protein
VLRDADGSSSRGTVCESPPNTEIRLSNAFSKKGGKREHATRKHREMPQERINARLFFALIA